MSLLTNKKHRDDDDAIKIKMLVLMIKGDTTWRRHKQITVTELH